MDRAQIRNPFEVLKEQAADLRNPSQRNAGGNSYSSPGITRTRDPNQGDTHLAMYWIDVYNDPQAVYYRSYEVKKYDR
jgi:hypothetical protein